MAKVTINFMGRKVVIAFHEWQLGVLDKVVAGLNKNKTIVSIA